MVGSVGKDGFPGEPLKRDLQTAETRTNHRSKEIMMFLQALPTKDWTDKDIELLLSEAFIWQSLFQDSRAHLRSGGEQHPDDGMR